MELFSPSSKKFKKCTPRKFLILQETEIPKKFLIFPQKKAFLIFQETETQKKIPYISGNGNPKKLLIFQEVTF